MGSIFISYRRDDATGHSGRLYDRLHTHFRAKHRVFRDLEDLEAGDDFVKQIKQIVGSCDVLIAIIGKQWLMAVDDQGLPRLKNPDDFVRLEIQTALARNILVIPTLVGGARMPEPQDLPSELAALAGRNAFQIHDEGFTESVNRLIKGLEEALKRPKPRMMQGHWAVRDEDGIHRVHAVIFWDFPRLRKLRITWDSIVIESSSLVVVAFKLRSFQYSGHSFKLIDRGVGIFGKLVLFMDGVEVPRMEDSKEEAEKLLDDLKKRDAAALRRYQAFQPGDPMPEPSLEDAQHVIAREQGFANWRELMRYLD